jgi:Flp pilus assembly pilin Flp
MSDLTLKLWVECQLLLEDAKANLREFERGQGMVEYSLILVLVAIAATATLFSMRGAIDARFTQVATCLNQQATAPGTDCVP